MKSGEVAHRVSHGAFYLAIEKVAALFAGIAYFALLSRWLGPKYYGIMTLALSFTGLAITATGNFEVYLERYAAEFQAREALGTLRRALGLVVSLKLALGLVASLLMVLLAPLLAHAFKTTELTRLLPVLSLMVAFDGFSTAGRATLYGLQRFRWLSLVAVLFHVARTVVVGILMWMHRGVFALSCGLVAITLAQGAATVLLPFWLLKGARDADGPDGAAPPQAPLLTSMIAYCAPLLGARVTFLSGQNLGKIVLGKLFTWTDLGLFSFAFQTVERFLELAYTLPSSLMPAFTHLVARGERERLRYVFDQAFRLIQVTACAISLGLFVFAREVTLLMGGPSFEPAVPLLRVMALVPMARTAQQPLTMLFQALRRPGTVLLLALLKFVTEFGSYFLLVPAFGPAGATWANFAGAAVSYVVSLALLAPLLPESRLERARAAALSIGLLAPFLVLSLIVSETLPGGLGLVVRLGMIPLWLTGVFALGLVNRYDLGKLSGVPLGSRWLRRSRDSVVAAADRLARVFEASGAT